MERTRCETFSRSMGYIRPVTYFNAGKYSEYLERKMFKESKCLAKVDL